MPYPNMPQSMWGKMDDCVKQVMKGGKSKQGAIAICYSSLMGKSMEPEFKASDNPGDYLIVEDREKPTTWHLQVRDGGTPDHRLMGAAWAALMSPNGYRGNKYEGPNKQEAIDKLRKLYDAEGMTVPSEKEMKDWGMDMPTEAMMGIGPTTIADALAQEQAQEQAEQINEAFGTFNRVISNIINSPDVPDKGAAVEREAGAFRQWFDSIISGAQNVAKQISEKVGARHSASDQEHLQHIHDSALALGAFCKEGKAASAFTLFKDVKGQWRWLAIATNNRRDSDHPAQILTEAAHKEFIDYLDAHPEAMPELWHWHTPGTKWGKADFADCADGFVVYAGMVDAGHEAEAERLAAQKEIGVSHGFIVLDHDFKNEHINQYRTFEISPLPLSAAANRWTEFELTNKELEMPFTPRKREYLAKVVGLGEERVAQLEKELDAANKALDAVGIEKKDDAAPTTETPPAPEQKEEQAWFLADMKPEEFTRLMAAGFQAGFEQTKEAQGAAIKEALGAFTKSVLEELAKVAQAQAALGGRISQLEGLTPRGYRATQAKETATDKTAQPSDDPRAANFQQFVGNIAGIAAAPKP